MAAVVARCAIAPRRDAGARERRQIARQGVRFGQFGPAARVSSDCDDRDAEELCFADDGGEPLGARRLDELGARRDPGERFRSRGAPREVDAGPARARGPLERSALRSVADDDECAAARVCPRDGGIDALRRDVARHADRERSSDQGALRRDRVRARGVRSIAHGRMRATRWRGRAAWWGRGARRDSSWGSETKRQVCARVAIAVTRLARTRPGMRARRRTSPPCETTSSRGPSGIAIGHALGTAQCAMTSSNAPSATSRRARATHFAAPTSRSGDSLTRAASPGKPKASPSPREPPPPCPRRAA